MLSMSLSDSSYCHTFIHSHFFVKQKSFCIFYQSCASLQISSIDLKVNYLTETHTFQDCLSSWQERHMSQEKVKLSVKEESLIEISSAHFLYLSVEVLWNTIIQGSIPLLLSNHVAFTDVR